MSTRVIRIDALAAADARGVIASPACVLIKVETGSGALPVCTLLAAGSPGEVAAHPAFEAAERVSRPRSVLLPALVNVHTHLDLTHIGPRPHDPCAGFADWIGMIRRERSGDREGIEASVRQGVALSLAGGTAAVGDIAGGIRGRASALAAEALARSGMGGVSYVEYFAQGERADLAISAAREALRAADACVGSNAALSVGLQPHAPYSVGRAGYTFAAEESRRGRRVCTHVGESNDEREFVERGTGLLRAVLEEVGVWDAVTASEFGAGRSPVEQVYAQGENPPALAVHVNQASDEDIALLARRGVSVAYCPRASAYFGTERHFGPHRYREMLRAGINVALGTDSVVNLPTRAGAAETGGMSVLDEMRFLYKRDGADSLTLLAMGTINGARALGLSVDDFSLRVKPGMRGLEERPIAGMIAVEPDPTPNGGSDSLLSGVLRSERIVEPLVIGRVRRAKP